MASAGTSSWVTAPSGKPSSATASYPGRLTPTKWASANSSSASRQVRICASASAPVMKNSSASACCARSARKVSTVYVGPARSISSRLTEKRGFDAVAMTVMR
jgi:hypothetical protein